MTVQGIDISEDQGDFDWEAWKGRIGFAAIRATSWTSETSFEADPQFARNWAQAYDAFGGKLVRIAYHYTRPGVSPAAVQARDFVSLVRDHGLEQGDHFMADFENADGEPVPYVAGWSYTFCHSVNTEAPYHRVFPYFDQSWAAEGYAAALTHWHPWIAQYDVTRPAIPAGWKTWAFWQYSGTGLDRDVYNGSQEALLDFARMPEKRR